MQIAVIGCGIIGLTTALVLCEAGHSVQLYGRARTPCTTSDRAAAIWWPDWAAEPAYLTPTYRQRVVQWARAAWACWQQYQSDGRYGIRPERCHLFYAERPDDALVAAVVADSQVHYAPELPGPLCWHWSFDSLLLEMPKVMPQLTADVEAAGCPIRERTFSRLEELYALDVDLVVNCTGLGSRELVGDRALTPIRGQLLHLTPQPLPYKLTAQWQGRSIYWMARADALLLGGSYEKGVNIPLPTAQECTAIWAAQQSWIAAGAAGLPVPRLKPDAIIGYSAGLRPYRVEGVCLEAVTTPSCARPHAMIHNYGHGGCGVSLAWGCAEEVVTLAHSLMA
ncbi:MAG: FAD-dependent oxidoreductase [Caldilineaceae bacterium]